MSIRHKDACHSLVPLLGIYALLTVPNLEPAMAAPVAPFTYPLAPRGTQVDEYHGVKVPDPYRWMEDIDSPDTRTWVAAQGQLSREFLDTIGGRDSMTQRLRDIWNFERWTPPVHHGGNWFFTHNDGFRISPWCSS